MKLAHTPGGLLTVLLIGLSLGSPAPAERAPVLQQIKVPHDYYFREMYLPQVSSGPQSPAWSPDGKKIAYVSDVSGEQQVWLIGQDGASDPVALTTDNDTWIGDLTWSADSKRLGFTDKRMRLWDVDVSSR